MKNLLAELSDKQQIIWDWNGTLLADVEHNVRTMNVLLESASLQPITVEHHREHFQFPVIEYYRKLGFDTSPDVFQTLCDDFSTRYYDGMRQCELVADVREVLESLSALGKTQCVLSASRQEDLVDALGHFGLSDIFQYVFGIEDNMATSKPERGRDMLTLSKISLDDTVLIGDTDHDLEVGKALGIDVILVDHGHQSFERLSAKHDRVIRSVPQPT